MHTEGRAGNIVEEVRLGRPSMVRRLLAVAEEGQLRF